MGVLQEIMQQPKNQMNISALKKHSIDLMPHSYRVAAMMEQIYPYLLKEELDITDVVEGALFHDIGKIFVSEEILDKTEKLTADEMNEIKRHPQYGAYILGDRSLEVRNMALLHHEKVDSSGYPYGYPGEILPLYSRILTVLDVYDALVSKRVYKNPCCDMKKIISALRDIPMFADKNVNKAVNLIKEGEIAIPDIPKGVLQ